MSGISALVFLLVLNDANRSVQSADTGVTYVVDSLKLGWTK